VKLAASLQCRRATCITAPSSAQNGFGLNLGPAVSGPCPMQLGRQLFCGSLSVAGATRRLIQELEEDYGRLSAIDVRRNYVPQTVSLFVSLGTDTGVKTFRHLAEPGGSLPSTRQPAARSCPIHITASLDLAEDGTSLPAVKIGFRTSR
jgi:hypothetical protein